MTKHLSKASQEYVQGNDSTSKCTEWCYQIISACRSRLAWFEHIPQLPMIVIRSKINCFIGVPVCPLARGVQVMF